MCELRLVLVPLLIGWKSGARTLNQSLSEVMQNQSNYIITFDTQLKTTLLLICFIYLCVIIITVIIIIAIRTCSFPCTTVNLGLLFCYISTT